MHALPDIIDGQPNICGAEEQVAEALSRRSPVFLPESRIDFSSIQSAFSIALHMQQPLIPAGGDDLATAALISNLQYMMEHQEIGDNHNASVFHWCYKRTPEFVCNLIDEGKEPRVMLDYAGCLLYGLQKMGLNDVIDALRRVTCQPHYRRGVEWLGCPWSHAVSPSTPVQDYRLHVRAWQQYFASLFGWEALGRVRGFSPAEMALPNHPEVFFEFVKTLKDCGYWWVLVQEHSVEETETGLHPTRPHLPHQLVARNAAGEEISILALVKTQGSDTKLVAQMQPMHEARSVGRQELDGGSVPALVSQIGDGENGGVMMNEFPDAFNGAMREATDSNTPAMCGTEYLEHLFASGIKEEELPQLQPVMQKRIWDRCEPGCGMEKLESAIEDLRKEDGAFHMEGGSWTNNLSWVEGYDNVLEPMNAVSAKFAQKVLQPGVAPAEPRFRNALFYLLVSQTSCYRYWGQGAWTDYAREICRRLEDILSHDF